MRYDPVARPSRSRDATLQGLSPEESLHEDGPVHEDASYTCPACGEQIVVPVDVNAGREQEYVEDCPVCCSPNVLTLELDPEGRVSLSARAE